MGRGSKIKRRKRENGIIIFSLKNIKKLNDKITFEL